MDRLKAFTLAEVLITLSIIGVVATLTVPNLINNYQKQQVPIALKKHYSILYNAYKMAIAENGTEDDWDFSLSAKDIYKNYLSPYTKGTFCEQNKTGQCKTYKNKRCKTCAYSYNYNPHFILDDGAYLEFSKDNGLFIKLDINGPQKPNAYGRDMFTLQVHNLTNKAYNGKDKFGFFCQYCGAERHAGGIRDRANFKNRCNQTDATNCGGLIQFDDWQIKDDYPW